MKIDLGNGYWLRSDALNLWVTKERTVKDKDATYEATVSGYHRNIPDLMVDFIDRRIGESQATSIKELEKEIRKIKRTVYGWKNMLTLDAIKEWERRNHDNL